jgi:hypothetical protein
MYLGAGALVQVGPPQALHLDQACTLMLWKVNSCFLLNKSTSCRVKLYPSETNAQVLIIWLAIRVNEGELTPKNISQMGPI